MKGGEAGAAPCLGPASSQGGHLFPDDVHRAGIHIYIYTMAGNVSHGETHDLVPSPNDLPVHPILCPMPPKRQQAPQNALVLTHLGGFHSWTLGLRLSWGSPGAQTGFPLF